ncbi:MAG: heme A synthase [Alphaproteobacteria bacterium]|nr:MAG: heme A synthase [Alphaproteobacteria bacterium]
MQKIQNTNRHLKAIAYWLFFCCFSVFCMIIVGAITRLSESGLSIVEWKPLLGAIPPLNEEEWRQVFEQYKSSPEYHKKNFWMSLSDFKSIFFWEWFHRLLGRLIGVFYAVPFMFFLVKSWIPKGYKLKLLIAFLLGGAQGFMGWYMVKSGLVDIPAVSHYRLCAHLSLALLIYGYMLWLGLGFRKMAATYTPNPDTGLYTHGWVTLGILTLTILWGAFTAGLDAGLVYNDTFPMMGDKWIPEELWFYKPLWLNIFENHAVVQFAHRWLAIITAITVISFVLHSMRKKRREIWFPALGIFIFLQVGLGIATLFSGVALPVAVLHQGGAVTILTLLLCAMHAVKSKQLPHQQPR